MSIFQSFFAIGMSLSMSLMVSNSLQAKKNSEKTFHRSIPLIDLHVDTVYHLSKKWYNFNRSQPTKDLDLPRMVRSGMGAQVFVLWVPPSVMKKNPENGWLYLKKAHLNFLRLLKESNGKLVHARTREDVLRIVKQGKIAALLAIEGAHPFLGQESRVQEAISWGLTYLGLTWNNSNEYASSGKDEWKKKRITGLTEKGKQLVRLLEKEKVLVDLSHAGKKTFWDVQKMATRPFIASHSNAYAIRPHYRNLTRKQIEAIAKSGGVVGLVFYTAFLVQGKNHRKIGLPPLFRHLKYLVQYAGIQHVGIGSDFDGLITKPKGLEHVGRFPYLTKKLREQGYKDAELRAILGANVLRLLPSSP